ncbi:MAG: hypothetical protein LBH24_00690 [Clostridiales bacterium]|jgi:shikimate dehydrogenase|nr:hypothetical protein [Clostridiales bacterium]
MKHFALIGQDIGYSLSPEIHRAAFAFLGAEAAYTLISFAPDEWADNLPRLKELDGFNVTKPHKTGVLRYLSPPSALPAVNTVLVSAGRFSGFSTDGAGLLRALDAAEFAYRDRSVLILGAGGAAVSAAAALTGAGARAYLLNRTYQRAAEAAALSGAAALRDVDALSAPGLAPYGLINCTTLGLAPGENPLPTGLDTRGAAWAYDMIYRPPITPFLREMTASGIRVSNGLSMLIHQAILADEIFLGIVLTERERQGLYRHIIQTLEKEKAV